MGDAPKPMAPPGADLDHILERTRPLFEELRGARVFVTGGSGFFGKWIAHSFAHANERLGLDAEMTLLLRDPDAFRKAEPRLSSRPSVRLMRGAMEDFAPPGGTFTHVIHMALFAGGVWSDWDPLRQFQANLLGTERVLEFAARSGVRKFLFTSSGAVYGKQPSGLTHAAEDQPAVRDPADPATAYAEYKRANEFQCAAWGRAAGFEVKISRCFAFVGPYLPLEQNFAVGNFIADVLAGRTVTVRGDGTPYRSYLYAADLAAWLWTILFKGVPFRPYNTGAERAVSIRELAHLVAEAGGRPGDVAVLGTPEPGVPPLRYVPATERARAELGLDEWVGLEESLARTFAWHGLKR